MKSFCRASIYSKDKYRRLFPGGWGNGYVCLPKGHPFYDMRYYDIPSQVHGGLTYGAISDIPHRLCPKYAVGHNIIGFDTRHGFSDVRFTKPAVYHETAKLKMEMELYGHVDCYLVASVRGDFQINRSIHRYGT